MNWPPPVGGFVLFQAEGRSVSDDNAFVSQMLLSHGETRSVQRANTTDRLKPQRDGSVLTVGGEIGHIRAHASYTVSSPARFLETIGDEEANALVRFALQRAIVQIGASHTLQELRESLTTDGLRSVIKEGTQTLLTETGSGLQVTSIELKQEILPPAAVQKNFENYSKARQQVSANVEQARKAAQQTLITVAGPMHTELAALIDEYEAAHEAGQTDEEASILARFDAAINRPDVSGTVSKIIDAARRHKISIEQTLGRDARLFAGLQEAYRKQPDAVIARRWLQAAGRVFSRSDIEVFQLPGGIGRLQVDLTGSQTIRDLRRSLRLDRVDAETWAAGYSGSSIDQFQRIEEIKMDKAGRQLAVDEKGRISGLREQN
jgi:regulator of protease activity HflC (stomatin/prohibitin superfamily)